jgi:hypothetical protein
VVDIEQKFLIFVLHIITLVSSANVKGSGRYLLLEEGHFYIYSIMEKRRP